MRLTVFIPLSPLLCFLVYGVLTAETTIFIHLESVRIVLLVFGSVVVALLALCTSQCDFNSHNGTSRFTEIFFAFTLPTREKRADRKSKRLPQFESTHFMPEHQHLEVFGKHRTICCTSMMNRSFSQKKRTFQR